MNTQSNQSNNMNITDLSIDILHMINQNTKYIRNKKRLNRKLKTAFIEVLHETMWDRPVRNLYTCSRTGYQFTIHKSLLDRYRDSPEIVDRIIDDIEEELEETD